ISEVAIAFLIDRFGMKRRNAVLTTLLPLLVLSPLCSLSLGPLKGFTLFGMTIFDFLDNFATNILLPIVSIGTCLYVGWFGPKRLLDWQLTNYETKWSPYTAPVLFVLRYVAPVLIVAILVSRFL
ncbi:MAG: sodium-dependent transporter, partial [Muribaculaceae bacterium]